MFLLLLKFFFGRFKSLLVDHWYFWWRLPRVWNPRWIQSLGCFFACTRWTSQIHLHASLGMLNYGRCSRLLKSVSLKLTFHFDEMIGWKFLCQKETGRSGTHPSSSISGYYLYIQTLQFRFWNPRKPSESSTPLKENLLLHLVVQKVHTTDKHQNTLYHNTIG